MCSKLDMRINFNMFNVLIQLDTSLIHLKIETQKIQFVLHIKPYDDQANLKL